MDLPRIIEIVPLREPVQAEITVPGSKSITNRALVLAALSQGVTELRDALWSEDTQVMVDCLRRLGFNVQVTPDARETCNSTITVQGQGGKIPRAGKPGNPLKLFVRNAGTAARFLTALVCLGEGSYLISGVSRMHERPQAGLFKALGELGYHIESSNDQLPAVIHGSGPREGQCRVSIKESSQFASALQLCARTGGWTIKVTGENAEEAPYVALTLKVLDAFPRNGGSFQIEPDCSSGSYFWAAGTFVHGYTKSDITVLNWPTSGWQMDQAFIEKGLAILGAFRTPPGRHTASSKETFGEPGFILSRARDLGDSIMTAMVLAPLAADPVQFTELGRLRRQECERVQAMHTQLSKCGVKVTEQGDTLTIFPSRLHSAQIETYDDHRMAMCFSILGLLVRGIRIKNPGCVKKTFPNFYQKLAIPPPSGLGAVIMEADSRRILDLDELFAY